MFQFIESIKWSDGKPYRLPFHQQRVNQVCDDFFHGRKTINLYEIIESQPIPSDGIYKVRITFDEQTENIEFSPYQLRKISCLKTVITDIPTTYYKSNDRTKINEAFLRKGNCDDVLLIKNSLITDTSYANVALYDGKCWFTPETPLIYGTQRSYLLSHNKIKTKHIAARDIPHYKSICLFNAMIEFEEIVIPVKMIDMDFE
ncbi:MAG: aminotransferase class IV [Paludibacteraceae bacterium]